MWKIPGCMDIHVKQFQDIFRWFVLFCLYVNLLENKKHDLLRFICDVVHLVIWQVCDIVHLVVWLVCDVHLVVWLVCDVHLVIRQVCDVVHLVIWQVCDVVRLVVWQVCDVVCILSFGRSVMLCILSFGRSVMLCVLSFGRSWMRLTGCWTWGLSRTFAKCCLTSDLTDKRLWQGCFSFWLFYFVVTGHCK